MGTGNYNASDWNKLKKSRKLSTSNEAKKTFKNLGIKQSLDSRYIYCRESKDSTDSPNATPVIIGFDVTDSMDYLAHNIATKSLNDTILKILETKTITNPHIMCAAFTRTDMPLQVTQFEADIRVVEQLLDFSLGGYNPSSADNLLWYFAAHHTKIDSFTKRGKKGILIGIGDEKSNYKDNVLKKGDIKATTCDEPDKKYTFSELIRIINAMYELFHIVIGEDCRFDPQNNRESYSEWCEALPGRVAKIHAKDIEYLDSLIVSIIRLSQGEDKSTVLSSIENTTARKVVEWGIEDMDFGPLSIETSKSYSHDSRRACKPSRPEREAAKQRVREHLEAEEKYEREMIRKHGAEAWARMKEEESMR